MPQDDDHTASQNDELQKLREIAARAQADLQNAKIRMERDAQEIRTFAMQGLIERLLPTIDNFQRSFEHLPAELKDHDWVKGLRATEQQLMTDLQSVGLSTMNVLGKPVDPARHEVVRTQRKDTASGARHCGERRTCIETRTKKLLHKEERRIEPLHIL